MKKTIYFDTAASTKVYPEVVKEMSKYFTSEYGNPSSLHELGEKAAKTLNSAREKIAKEISCKPYEIIFTSGATESNNLAIQGLAKTNKSKNKILISAIEHPSVSEVCENLRKWGYEIVKIPVNSEGFIDLNFLENEINDKTLLVSIMHVNNVFGTIQDVKKIGNICNKKNVIFHTDAAQSFGKLKIYTKDWNVDLLSGSAHKIGGPKGIGFLYINDKIKIEPLFYGGGQEKGLRSGTENVPAITGFAKTLEIQKEVDKNKIKKIRDKLMKELEKIGGKINGPRDEKRIYNNVHVSFSNISAEELIFKLSQKRIYVSAGSACDSKKKKEDDVLKALGLNDKEISGSIRFTLDEYVSDKDVDFVAKEVRKIVNKFKTK